MALKPSTGGKAKSLFNPSLMPRRLLLALIVIVAAPLVLLGWLSASTYQQQQQETRKQLNRFFKTRLAEIDRSLADVFDEYARDLTEQLSENSLTLTNLQTLDRQHPIVRQSIWVDPNLSLIHI